MKKIKPQVSFVYRICDAYKRGYDAALDNIPGNIYPLGSELDEAFHIGFIDALEAEETSDKLSNMLPGE